MHSHFATPTPAVSSCLLTPATHAHARAHPPSLLTRIQALLVLVRDAMYEFGWGFAATIVLDNPTRDRVCADQRSSVRQTALDAGLTFASAGRYHQGTK